ncbi:GIY-YIG nuclease family protein [Thiohalorhabdus sp.]|uniref:GIY-YIG nuclease family protein n=1 Tax=Thiohalorhabdus sp. TaxID=3094134 RepID=UPI002FC27D02
MTAQWSVYILETAAGSYYTGVATDPMARYRDHEAGRGARAVRMAGGPRRLLWQLDGLDRGTALQLERAIKALSRPTKERLVTEGPEAAGLATGSPNTSAGAS